MKFGLYLVGLEALIGGVCLYFAMVSGLRRTEIFRYISLPMIPAIIWEGRQALAASGTPSALIHRLLFGAYTVWFLVLFFVFPLIAKSKLKTHT